MENIRTETILLEMQPFKYRKTQHICQITERYIAVYRLPKHFWEWV